MHLRFLTVKNIQYIYKQTVVLPQFIKLKVCSFSEITCLFINQICFAYAES